MLNPAAPVDIRHECALRLAVIDEQRRDLMAELTALWQAIVAGEHVPKVYRQLKMYNDANLRTATQRRPVPDPERANVIAFPRKVS
jgi:hypothetical protein